MVMVKDTPDFSSYSGRDLKRLIKKEAITNRFIINRMKLCGIEMSEVTFSRKMHRWEHFEFTQFELQIFYYILNTIPSFTPLKNTING